LDIAGGSPNWGCVGYSRRSQGPECKVDFEFPHPSLGIKWCGVEGGGGVDWFFVPAFQKKRDGDATASSVFGLSNAT
jgi:hypothetical protein